MGTATIISLAIGGLSAAAAIVSTIVAVCQARQAVEAAKQADKHAARSTAAAEKASGYQHEIAESLKKLEPRYKPGWKLQHQTRALYLLINDSEEYAYDVTLDTDSQLARYTGSIGDIPPGGHHEFVYPRDGGYGVYVSWRRPGETEKRVWRSTV